MSWFSCLQFQPCFSSNSFLKGNFFCWLSPKVSIITEFIISCLFSIWIFCFSALSPTYLRFQITNSSPNSNPRITNPWLFKSLSLSHDLLVCNFSVTDISSILIIFNEHCSRPQCNNAHAGGPLNTTLSLMCFLKRYLYSLEKQDSSV